MPQITDAKVVYEYPKGKFRFPVIPDQNTRPREKDDSREQRTRRPASRYSASQPKPGNSYHYEEKAAAKNLLGRPSSHHRFTAFMSRKEPSRKIIHIVQKNKLKRVSRCLTKKLKKSRSLQNISSRYEKKLPCKLKRTAVR